MAGGVGVSIPGAAIAKQGFALRVEEFRFAGCHEFRVLFPMEPSLHQVLDEI
jgi:hypothetical protein